MNTESQNELRPEEPGKPIMEQEDSAGEDVEDYAEDIITVEHEDAVKMFKDPKVTLTEEEMQLSPAVRAVILQKKIRDQRAAREKEELHLAEKKRIMSQKALLESKQKLDELEARRAREQLEREKKEKREAEERQRELLRLDYRERFGQELNEEEIAEKALAKKSSREQIKHWVGRLAVVAQRALKEANVDTHEMNQVRPSVEEIAKCIKILITYCDNAVANPLETKFLTISKSNKAFQERVAPIADSIKLLKAVGFQDTGDHMTIQGYPNTHALSQASDLLKHVQKLLA